MENAVDAVDSEQFGQMPGLPGEGNVGVDNNYRPVSFSEVKAIIEDQVRKAAK